jgi:hypothetical protein
MRLETRCLFPQNPIISGMNGRLFNVPLASSVDKISSGSFTSTRSPGRSLDVICRIVMEFSGSVLGNCRLESGEPY